MYFLIYNELQQKITILQQFAAKPLALQLSTGPRSIEHLKMYQNPNFHIVFRICTLKRSSQCTNGLSMISGEKNIKNDVKLEISRGFNLDVKNEEEEGVMGPLS